MAFKEGPWMVGAEDEMQKLAVIKSSGLGGWHGSGSWSKVVLESSPLSTAGV